MWVGGWIFGVIACCVREELGLRRQCLVSSMGSWVGSLREGVSSGWWFPTSVFVSFVVVWWVKVYLSGGRVLCKRYSAGHMTYAVPE